MTETEGRKRRGLVRAVMLLLREMAFEELRGTRSHMKQANALYCCYLFPTEKEPEGDLEKPCGEDAEWMVWDGKEPAYDHYTHACTKHVGELLSDSDQPHQVYPVAWDQPVLEVA